MDLTITIPDADVADLTAFTVKRFLVLYPGWDTAGVDVLQAMLDDFVQDQCCESHVSKARWDIDEATPGELAAAMQAESDARDAKQAMEASRLTSRAS